MPTKSRADEQGWTHGADYAKRQPTSPDQGGMATWPMMVTDNIAQSSQHSSKSQHGVGMEADLITLNPISNVLGSGWFWEFDAQGQSNHHWVKPFFADLLSDPLGYDNEALRFRKVSPGRSMRFSRALLESMSRANAVDKRSMFAESWPASLVWHSHLPDEPSLQYSPGILAPRMKAVYVPHPVFTNHAWTPAALGRYLNSSDLLSSLGRVGARDFTFYDGPRQADLDAYSAWLLGACRTRALLRSRH